MFNLGTTFEEWLRLGDFNKFQSMVFASQFSVLPCIVAIDEHNSCKLI